MYQKMSGESILYKLIVYNFLCYNDIIHYPQIISSYNILIFINPVFICLSVYAILCRISLPPWSMTSLYKLLTSCHITAGFVPCEKERKTGIDVYLGRQCGVCSCVVPILCIITIFKKHISLTDVSLR